MRRYVIALSLAVMLPLPALAAEVIVKSGETLSEIAERHNIPLSRLLKLNGISDPDLVEVGRKLVLPSTAAPRRTAAAGSPSNAASVTVKQGETLSLIAARHDVPVSQLIKLNRITDPDQLKVGSKLLLKGASPSPSRPSPTTARPQSTSSGPAKASPPSPRVTTFPCSSWWPSMPSQTPTPSRRAPSCG